MIRKAEWDTELSKEASKIYMRELLEKLYPSAEVENVRDRRISGVDWIVHMPSGEALKIDDKTDNWLGYTGNISLDQMTTVKKECLQLFVNPDFLGKFLLLDNNKIDAVTLLLKSKVHKMVTDGNVTRTFIIPIKHIEKAIIKAAPSIEWFKIRRRFPETRAQGRGG